jgi:hypothetical protein
MRRAIIVGLFLSLAGCADLEVESATSAEKGGGTACGPNGLVCNRNETCCAMDPLPPAPVRYVCLSKGQTCNP